MIFHKNCCQLKNVLIEVHETSIIICYQKYEKSSANAKPRSENYETLKYEACLLYQISIIH